MNPNMKVGQLAFEFCAKRLPLEVLRSAAGYYIGTFDESPCSRESVEYYQRRGDAQKALDENSFTQRDHP